MIFKLLFLISLCLVSRAYKSYEGYKVIELSLTTDAEVKEVLRLSEVYQADIWKGPSKVVTTHIMLSPISFDLFVNSLRKFGLKYTIINENVQNSINKEYISNNAFSFQSLASLTIPSISNYYPTFEEIDNWIEKMGKLYNFTSVGSIGKTYEGRTIKYIKISTGVNRKAILMDGGIHAREWLAVATVNYIIEKIIVDYNKGDRFTVNLLSKYDFYFIPVLNPDGYAYTHLPGNRLWRKNRKPHFSFNRICYGTDLNRNFDADFGGAKTSSNPCAETYGGPYAFSELESVAFSNFITKIKSNLQLYMSLHSYAQFWFVPYAYTEDAPNDDYEMRRVANIGNDALYRANGVRFIVGTPSELLYTAAGGSYDWIKLKVGVKYAYTLEVRPQWGIFTGGQGFIAPISDIKYSGKEVYEGLVATALAMKT